MTEQNETNDVRSYVRERYGKYADKLQEKASSECVCSPFPSTSSCCGYADEPSQLETVSKMYQDPDIAGLPPEVTDLSLGCGDPVTLATLLPGQVVLDLGSGGGIDCFLAAKKVGSTGKVIGVDMTPSMIERARANKEKLGAVNVEFRLGEIENLPVADASVDVIISNCVINLSPDKPQVFREAFRALRPGGKLAVSDIVTDGPLPEAIKKDLSKWAGCVAGALEAKDYLAAIEAAGFREISLTPVYMDKEIMEEAAQQLDLAQIIDIQGESYQKSIYSAKVTAYKPT
jgi:arsenite methyltransferase